jgi:lipopolysaccharide transport system ATP-binding protein
MEEVGKEGRTVLFVSHNMATLNSLCHNAIWLVNGTVKMQGGVQKITSNYLTYGTEYSGQIVFNNNDEHNFWFKKISLLNVEDNITSKFNIQEPIRIRLEFHIVQLIKNLEISLRIYNSSGIPIFSTNRSSSTSSDVSKGTHITEIEIPSLFLVPGSYSIDIASHIPNVEIISHYQSLLTFEIEETGSDMALYKGSAYGVVFVDIPWKELNLC